MRQCFVDEDYDLSFILPLINSFLSKATSYAKKKKMLSVKIYPTITSFEPIHDMQMTSAHARVNAFKCAASDEAINLH